MIFLSALATSFDSFVIGFSLKLNNFRLKYWEYLLVYIFTLLIFIMFHLVFFFLKINYDFNYLQPLIFFLLAIFSLKENDFNNQLSFRKLLLFVFTNALDGLFVSLTFIYMYSRVFLCIFFSLVSFVAFIIGNHLPFKIKKRKYLNFFLFLILAFISLF